MIKEPAIHKFLVDNHKELQQILNQVKPNLKKIYDTKGIQALIETYNNTIDNAHQKANISDLTTCNNCSYCCHSEINITSLEASYILAYIEFKGIKPNKEHIKTQNSKKWHKLNYNQKKCGLLDKNGKCSIYQARPSICRLWNSTSDPLLCKEQTNTTGTVRILQNWGLSVALVQLDDQINNNKEPILLHKVLNVYL